MNTAPNLLRLRLAYGTGVVVALSLSLVVFWLALSLADILTLPRPAAEPALPPHPLVDRYAARYRSSGNSAALLAAAQAAAAVEDWQQALAYWALLPIADRPLRIEADAAIRLGRWSYAVDLLRALIDDPRADREARHWAAGQLGILLAPIYPQESALLLRAAGDPTLGSILIALERGGDPLRIGVAIARAGQWAAAEQIFSTLETARGRAYLALARDQQNKPARYAAESALALAGDDPLVLAIYGLVLRSEGDYATSRDAWLAASLLAPDNPAYMLEVGAAYLLLDDRDQAEVWFAQARDRFPDDGRLAGAIETFDREEQALVEAIADRLLSDLLPNEAPPGADETQSIAE